MINRDPSSTVKRSNNGAMDLMFAPRDFATSVSDVKKA